MKPEKQPEHNFDFFNKKTIVENTEKKVEKIIPKKEKFSINSIGFSLPQGLWGVLIAALGLFGLYNKVEYAGWVLFLAFFCFDSRKGLIPFACAALGLLGLHYNVEYAGWLIVAAFFTHK